MSRAFVYNPKRDASRAIRGFYYQIELTATRWLELRRDTVLICECEEDIDHVARLPDADFETQRRILEQVKLRERLTLRSREALSALARFHEALAANPAIDLRYRFSTTATVGREEGGGFPRGLPGITAWELASRGGLVPEEMTAFVIALKGLVADSQSPPDLPSTAYPRFQRYVANADGSALIDELVRPFEWATGLPDPPRLLAKIHRLLLEQGKANVGEEASHLADVVLMHVLRLLTGPGEKRLTVEALDNLIRERSLTEVDRRILTKLTTQVEQAEAYMAQMASQMGVISQGVARLQAMPEQLGELGVLVADVQTRIAASALPAPDDPPVLTEALTRRPSLIRELRDALGTSVWLSIQGATGMGKTYAAKLLADEYGSGNATWIALRGERLPSGIGRRIDLQLLRHVDDPALIVQFFSGEAAFAQLGTRAAQSLSLIVVDELPDLLKEPGLAERLVTLTRALSASGGRLVTTTTGTIPQRVFDELGEKIQGKAIPPMNSLEIDEILTGAGAADAVRQRSYLDMITGVTHGHPLLVSAVVAYLRRRSWAISSDDLLALLTEDVARGVKTETVRNVTNLVNSAEARELLYRLSLVGDEFDGELVFEVASVPPKIPRAGEYLLELIGPWVNRLPSERMEVSPLLSLAGYEVLGIDRCREIHRAVAIGLARKAEVDQNVALQIVVHAAAGAEWHLLVGFTLRLAVQIRDRTLAEAFRPLTLLFRSSWPEDMPQHYRIAFRAVQVRLRMLLGEDEPAAAEDLERLIAQAQREDSMAVLMALFLTGPMNPAAGPGALGRRVLQARRILAVVPAEVSRFADGVPFEALVWLGVTKIRSLSDVREVLSVLREMTPEERAACFGYAPLADAPQLFVDQCWIQEVRKGEQDRDWDSVLGVLDEVREIGGMPGGSNLLALEARARAVVLADHLARYEEAMDVIERRLEDADANGRFLLDYTAGCILLDHSTPIRAFERFRRALTAGATGYEFLRVDAGRLATEAAGRSGEWLEAIREAKEALYTFKAGSLKSVLRYERLEIIGELAWAHWSAGNRQKACAAMSAVVRSLVAAPNLDQARFREVFGKAGHVLGWMAAVAKHSEPPTHGADGSPYTEPFPGILSRSRPGVAEPPVRLLVHVLSAQLGFLAAGVGFVGLARKSLLAARASAESAGFGAFGGLMDLELAEVAAAAGDYTDAVRRGIAGVRALAVRRRADRRLDVLGGTFSLQELWAELTEVERREIERSLFWSVVGPAVTGTLADAGSAEIGALNDALDEIVLESARQLSDVENWRAMLREVRVAFSSLATCEIVRGQLNEYSREWWMSILLQLALGEASDSTLRDSCAAQAVAFEALLRRRSLSEVMVGNVIRYIFRFWRRVADRGAFALRRPQRLRAALASIGEESSWNAAAEVLLAAAEATGVILGDELVRGLRAGGGC